MQESPHMTVPVGGGKKQGRND